MIKKIKQLFYFPIANYFRFFAQIRLARWNPKVIVITGSSGKTTLLHLIESQLGNKAKYSHFANSSYGIPFDILGLKRNKLTPDEWIYLFLLAPLKVFSTTPKEKLYVVEADCDRPGEGKFLANLLNPEITLWINTSLTHSANFDQLINENKFPSVEEAIAYEFGYFPEYTRKLVIANGDSELILKQLKRTKAITEKVTIDRLRDYRIYNNRTEFVIEDKKYSFNFITPKNVFYSIQMTSQLMRSMNLPLNPNFEKLNLPPGRSSVFKGIKNTTIIDSTYNATPDGVKAVLEMFNNYSAKNKWLVLGDMIELGNKEKDEHEKLAEIINSINLSKTILIGPRVTKYIFSKLKTKASNFLLPNQGLNYILKNLNGGEVILFKGARFLEGIIERLLLNKKDADKLVRRELVWRNRRKAFGL